MVSVCLIKLCEHLFCRLPMPILEVMWTFSTAALIQAVWRTTSFCLFVALLLAPAGSPQFIYWKNREQHIRVHPFHSPSLIKPYICQSFLSCRLKSSYIHEYTHTLSYILYRNHPMLFIIPSLFSLSLPSGLLCFFQAEEQTSSEIQ